MEWSEGISRAIDYIENHLKEEITIGEIAQIAFISPYYFQKGFSMLCGFSVSEYIKKRRLTLAASDLLSTNKRIIDIALDYGYDSPDSFTKAFIRFHGATPSAIRRKEAVAKSFSPLTIKISLIGGKILEYKIVDKAPFTVVGVSKNLDYNTADIETPKFWAEFYTSNLSNSIKSVYGISIDQNMDGISFEYVIADNYNPLIEIPKGCKTWTIPQFTWAIFPCRGAVGNTNLFQEINQRVFSEWLPQNRQYEIAAGYHLEVYDDPARYPKGINDENYLSEIWIPIRKREN